MKILFNQGICILLALSAFSFKSLHPFYLSITELNYNQQSHKMEISVKLFIDDFEKTLLATTHDPVNLSHPKDAELAEKMVAAYIVKHLSVNCDQKNYTIQFLGYEKEGEAIWAYFETTELNLPKNISVTSSLLYQLFTEQSNIIHVQIGNTKKSFKLNYPDQTTVFQF
jgi:hypothetical protein